jgi:putative endonuclease
MPKRSCLNTTNYWYVYIVRCSDDSLYTGVTVNVERRVQEHNGDELQGAKYTRARQPVVLVYQEPLISRSMAMKREYEIKRLKRIEKEELIQQHQS